MRIKSILWNALFSVLGNVGYTDTDMDKEGSRGDYVQFLHNKYLQTSVNYSLLQISNTQSDAESFRKVPSLLVRYKLSVCVSEWERESLVSLDRALIMRLVY